MPYFVYILYAERFDKYYIGQTSSVNLRLERHNEFDMINSFTAKYRPWKLSAYVEVGQSRGDAMKVERRLKALKSKKMLAQFIAHPEKLFEFARDTLAFL